MEETDLNRTADASGEPSDAHLMLAVAERRDVKAFEQLYRRYERPAYNLSLYLSGNSTAAEEALQEAALRVWRLAKNFRPDGSFKGWFFTIVADCCVKQRRGGLREKARAERHAERYPSEGTIEPGTAMENRELKRALNEQMACLEPQDRRLLALYYGADLSQQEIGRVLDVPQTTVSLKLREALGKLRAGLTTAGFAAAVPLLEAGKLGEALLGGTEVPAGLGARILESLGSAAGQSVRAAAASKGAAGVWVALGVFAAAAVGVAASGRWTANNDSISAPVEKIPAEAQEKTPSLSPAAQPGKLFQHLWTFEDSKDPHMVISQNNCLYVEGVGWQGSVGLKTIRPAELRFFKVPMDRFPMRFSYKAKLVDEAQTGSSIRPAWNDASYRTFGVFNNIFKPLPTVPGTQGWHEYTTYITPNLIFHLRDGAPEILGYVELAEKRELAVLANGVYLVDDLCFEQIEEKDVPDLSHFQAAAAAIPPSQRTGRQPLRSLPIQDNLKPAFIEFLLSPVQPLKKDGQATTAPNQAPDRKE